MKARALIVVGLAAVAGCGSGGDTKTVSETKTVTAPERTVTQTSTGAGPTAPAAAPDAAQYARRSYVVQPSAGKRVFEVVGPRATVTAADGSTISAYAIVLADSGDGTGQAVLLFRGSKFLGWASDRLAVKLSVRSAGQDVAVKYGNYQGDDPFCCPSSFKTVDYTWNGTRIVADSDPPLAFGKPGDKLRLAAAG